MYAGTTLSHRSGNIVGAHQRIDRIAKKHLIHRIGRSSFFPSIKTILHFEGRNGPDGIKSKSPSVDEPWHFINPEAGLDDPLIQTIKDHMFNLAAALKAKDEIRAGFEAAWLSHAVVDGLTPAHHYPLAEKIEELFGKPHYERAGAIEKNVIIGRNARDTLSKNWKYWGVGGTFTAHWGYEWGFASAIAIKSFKDIGLTNKDFLRIEKEGYIPYFLESVKTVDELGTYQEYMKTEWSAYLGQVTRKELAPLIMKNVVLAWYATTRGIVK